MNGKAADHGSEALNPCGIMPEVRLHPLAPRPDDLNGRVVCIIHSWPKGSGSQLEGVLVDIAEGFAERFPGVRIVFKTKPSAYQTDDRAFWDEVVGQADAFVYGAAPSCATTMYAVKYSGLLEGRGLPGVPVIFDNLIEDARITCSEIGMRIRWMAVPYPPEKISEGDMATIIQRIAEALTSPPSGEETRTGVTCPPPQAMIVSRGTFEEINDDFLERGWTDGLPIVPPTPKKVAEMLKGTSHNPGEWVTEAMWPSRWKATVQKVAVVGVMAGCRPEYMPVLLAHIEAFSQCGSPIRSTNSFSYMRVVNGPVRREIGMNAGTYALGPGNRANATIGRFLSLAIITLGGGKIGANLMGTQGNVSSYGFCFPENEEESPWESFAVENGYRADESTLAMFATGWSHCGNYLGGSVEALARAMAQFTFPSGMVVLTSPARAKQWAGQGKGKEDLKAALWSHAVLPMGVFRQDAYYKKFIEPVLRGKPYENFHWPKEYLELPDDAVVPVYPREGVQVIVVGADQNPMMQGWKTGYPTIVSIDKWR